MKDIVYNVYNVEICRSSFESRSDVYNFVHRDLYTRILKKVQIVLTVKGNIEVNPRKLDEDGVQEFYFLWKAINLFRKNGSMSLFNKIILMSRANGDTWKKFVWRLGN